jgi:plastocyanin
MRSGAIFLLGLTLGGIGVAVAADPPVIRQKNREFAPARIEVKPGSDVTFLNDDDTMHHVYVDTAKLKYDSGAIAPGQSVTVKFPQAGAYDVMCAIHPRMKLRVNVR